jgi:hypothetical protein
VPRRLLVPLLALAAAAVGAWLLLGRAPPPTDRELIRRLVDDAARAATERRVSDAVEPVSESFRAEGLGKTDVKRIVAAHVLAGEWASVSVTDARIEVQGDRATAIVDTLMARASGTGKSLADLLPGDAALYRFDCGLAREPDGWRVVTGTWRRITVAEALAGP